MLRRHPLDSLPARRRLGRLALAGLLLSGLLLPGLLLSGLLLAGLTMTASRAVADSPVASVAAAPLELLMVEQPGCAYCARWHEEIGPQYPLTDEGRQAPLRSQQLRAPVPDDIHLAAPPVFTPTFILLAGGREIGRLEGYPGEDFFWPLLAALIARADAR